jgi:putative copper export protein
MTLIVKLLLAAPMLLLGAVNGFRYGPRAERLAAAGDREGQTTIVRGFLRSVKVEAALGVLVLLAAAILVFVTPGRNDAMEAGGGSARAGQQEVQGR